MCRGEQPVVSRPSNAILPSCTRSRPNTVLNRVDLPAPFAPMIVVMAPRAMLAVVPLRMVMLPYPETTSVNVRMGSGVLTFAASMSQIGVDHLGIAPHGGRRALGDEPS